MATYVYSEFPPIRLSNRIEKSFFVGGLVQIIDQTRTCVEFEILAYIGTRPVARQLVLTKIEEDFTLDRDGEAVVKQGSLRDVIDWLNENY